jgi:hypothetical protein
LPASPELFGIADNNGYGLKVVCLHAACRRLTIRFARGLLVWALVNRLAIRSVKGANIPRLFCTA